MPSGKPKKKRQRYPSKSVRIGGTEKWDKQTASTQMRVTVEQDKKSERRVLRMSGNETARGGKAILSALMALSH